MTREFDIVVVGGGLAGLSAAYHAAIRGAEVACLEPSGLYGGLVANVGALDGLPGGEGLPGASYADTMRRQCEEAGVGFIADGSKLLSPGGSGIAIQGEAERYISRKVILASGATLRRTGVPGESELEHKGVSFCSWCDGGLFRGERVAVIGGGDSALQAALHLVSMCSGVDVIARGELKARRSYVLAAADNPNVTFHWGATVKSIDGDGAVDGITIEADGDTRTLPCSGVFVYAGLVSATGGFPAEGRCDEAGAIVTDGEGRTSVEGIFAAGAVRSGYRGQGVNAMGEGATAALAAIAELDA